MLENLMTDSINLRPLDRVDFRYSFENLKTKLNISSEKIQIVQGRCADYILCLCTQIFNRLPSNIDVIEKIKFFSPTLALARESRPLFKQLLFELIGI